MTRERLRQLAQQCRELGLKSVEPEDRALFMEWALEFDAEADAYGSFLTDEKVLPVLNAMAVSRRKEGRGGQSG